MPGSGARNAFGIPLLMAGLVALAAGAAGIASQTDGDATPSPAGPDATRPAVPGRGADLRQSSTSGVAEPGPACTVASAGTAVSCPFACVAGQAVHGFINGAGRVVATCGGDACTRDAPVMGGCVYGARSSGQGRCLLSGAGTARCYSVPLV